MLEMCRICLHIVNEADCVSVFHKISDNKSVIEIMSECTSIQIMHGDDLPRYICLKCVEKLNLCYGFRNLIINSDLQLRGKFKIKAECFDSASQAVVGKEENSTNAHCVESDKVFKTEECMLNERSTDENYKSFLEQSDTSTNLEQSGADAAMIDFAMAEVVTKMGDSGATSKLLKSPEVPKELEQPQTQFEYLNSASQAFVGSDDNLTNDQWLLSYEEFKIKRYTSNVSFLNENNKDFSELKMNLYECKECNKTFKTAKGLKNHNENHGIGTPFSCAFCTKTFRKKWALRMHTMAHTGDTPFTCDVCQKSFGSAGSLLVHKRVHTGVKQFICDVCNKAFYQFGQLQVHMRRHTGEKPFMCEICSRTFSDNSCLIRHKGRHQEQLMPCPTCGKTYKGWPNLQQHMKRHNGLKPFACNECGQKFTQQTSLNKHLLLHAGIKPYQCKICEKSFSQDSILFRHMRMHSGEKPYPCTLCPKEFAYKHHLQGHVKNHHKDALANSDSVISDNSQEVTENTTDLESTSVT